MNDKERLGNGLIDMKAIIKECTRIKELFPDTLSHTNLGRGISFYQNGEHTYQTFTINNKGGHEIVKTTFNTFGNVSISIDAKYISRRSFNSIVNRLKKITGEETK